ncbi:hypothetical protein CORI_1447 [Campylobacter sp. CCUG 57310]|nr:hypothetical protein CORI_1447 [Campylobacter sp. CCUG 57310]
MIYDKFSVFHKAILAFFLLIFLSGCGYKADPFYDDSDRINTTKTEKINKL